MCVVPFLSSLVLLGLMCMFLLFVSAPGVLSFYGLRYISTAYRWTLLVLVVVYVALALVWEKLANCYLRPLLNYTRQHRGHASFSYEPSVPPEPSHYAQFPQS